MSTTRRELRQRLRTCRQDLSAGQRLAAADAVARHLAAQPALRRPGYVAGYWAVKGELPLHSVQLRLAPGQVWCLPLVQDDGTLLFAPWRPGDALAPNRFGIPEPVVEPTSALAAAQLAIVLMPLLGFDAAGRRLGMGGGFYDRTLAFRHALPSGAPHLVGIGFACQEVAEIPAESWDVALDAVVTEHGWRSFGR